MNGCMFVLFMFTHVDVQAVHDCIPLLKIVYKGTY